MCSTTTAHNATSAFTIFHRRFRWEDISLVCFFELFSVSTNGSYLRLVFAPAAFVSHWIVNTRWPLKMFNSRISFFIAVLAFQKRDEKWNKAGTGVIRILIVLETNIHTSYERRGCIHVENCQRVLRDIGFPRFNVSARLYISPLLLVEKPRGMIVWEISRAFWFKVIRWKVGTWRKSFPTKISSRPYFFHLVDFFMRND